jgi:hypothetical protein
MILIPTHGAQEGYILAPLRRLLPFEFSTVLAIHISAPFTGELLSEAARLCIFFNARPSKGYYQVAMAAADILRTAIVTPFGLCEKFFNGVWTQECGPGIPWPCGSDFLPPPFCLLTWTTTSSPARSWKSTCIISESLSTSRKRTVCR